MLTKQDAHNLLVFLNRVQTTGLDEANTLAALAKKLIELRDAQSEEVNG